MLTSLGSEWDSVARMIRNDQDSLMQLLQLGLVVLVSVSAGELMRGAGRGKVHPQPPSHLFSRAPRRARSQTCQSCSSVSS